MTHCLPLAVAGGYLPHLILGIYMLMLLWLCYLGYRKGKATEEDYYLAGRGQGTLVTSLTIMATFFSSAALLGIPGVIYRDGVSFFLFALGEQHPAPPFLATQARERVCLCGRSCAVLLLVARVEDCCIIA